MYAVHHFWLGNKVYKDKGRFYIFVFGKKRAVTDKLTLSLLRKKFPNRKTKK